MPIANPYSQVTRLDDQDLHKSEFWVGDPEVGLTFNAAATFCNAYGACTLVIPAGTHTLTANLSTDYDVDIRVCRGATIARGSYTITISSPNFVAPTAGIFTGTGTITFHRATVINVVWFTTGGEGSSGGAWTGPSSLGGFEAIGYTAGSSMYYAPSGYYSVRYTIPITKDYVQIWGDNRGLISSTSYTDSSTWIRFAPYADDVLFDFAPAASGAQDGYFGGMYLQHNSSYASTAISVQQGSRIKFENIFTNSASSTQWNKALETRGHELLTFDNCYWKGTYPLFITVNPGSATISGDNFTFRNNTFYCTAEAGDYGCIHVDENVAIFSLNFLGYNSWLGGKHGFYWPTATNAAWSQRITFENIKIEQSAISGGYAFYFPDATKGIRNVKISGVTCSDRSAGFIYARDVTTMVIENSQYNETGNWLDVDTTCSNIWMIGNFCNPSTTRSIGNMVEVLGIYGNEASGYEENGICNGILCKTAGTYVVLGGTADGSLVT